MITTTTRTALPSWALDLIAFGIEESDSRVPLFGATLSLASSAVARGFTETDFRNALQDGVRTGKPQPSNQLWQQITHRRRRKLGWNSVNHFLTKAWQWAVENVARGMDSPQREADLLALAERWSHAIGDPTFNLSQTETLVLEYVVSETARRKYRYVTCPGRAVAEYCGVPHTTAVEALDSLRKKGILLRKSRGIWMGEGDLQPLGQHRGEPDHLFGDVEDDRGLLPVAGYTEDFGGFLAISD